MPNLAARLGGNIAGHGQRFEVDLGGHNGGAEAEQDARLQILNGAGEDQEIAIAGFAGGGAIAVGMLMQNVVADADMHGDGYRQAIGRGKDAGLLVGIIALLDATAYNIVATEAKR